MNLISENICDHAKLLLVDDEPNNIYVLTLKLRKHGYKFDSANNG